MHTPSLHANTLVYMAVSCSEEYIDARGKQRTTIKHEMYLPHELVASFYKREDLFSLLTGPPGAS